MVDFAKMRQTRSQSKAIDPKDIFLRLPKPPGIDDLWSSQADALKDWFQRRNQRDIVIKLNTGGGKTLVGLLISQSVMNEFKGSTLYLCPTSQLQEQTLTKAREYGIPAIPYSPGADLDDKFLSAQSVMVATYAALFNGLTRFGLAGGARDVVKLEAIILDDAHTAFANLRDAFTISIDSKKQASIYQELVQQFRADFAQLGRQGTFDDVIAGRDESVLEIPYWSWKSKSDEIRDTLAAIAQNQFPFEWPLMRDCFNLCHALVSSRDFSITPLFPLVDMFPTFATCPRRIYMSATVADDSSIIRTFDADTQSISKPIAPVSLAGIGERMILAPELMLLSKNDREAIVSKLAQDVAKTAGVVFLVPSTPATQRWAETGTVVAGDEVAVAVKNLVNRSSNGPYVFANRFDGIDLPGDACRLLVLDGLPRGSSSYDLYRASILEGSGAVNTTIAQRIEQGMGRGTRGAGDHCVVLLTGKGLIGWLSRSANLRLLTATTRAQLQLGIDISKDISDLKSLRAAIEKSLKRSPDWTQYHAEVLADAISQPLLNPQNLAVAECERKYFKLARDGYYEKAIAVIEKFLKDNDTLESRIKGWLYQLAARVADLWGDSEKASNLQQQAYGFNHELLRPRIAIQYTPLLAPSNQSRNIIAEVAKFELRRGFLSHFEEITDWLTPNSTSNQFEEALKTFGELLGFSSQRPERDTGKGPDVLWLLNSKSALILSAKSQKIPGNPLNKEEHGQLLEAAQWFQQEYPSHKGYRVVVHPNHYVTEEVTPEGSFALTMTRLRTLIGNARNLFTDLCDFPLSESTMLAKCDKRLIELNLTPEKLIKTFLEPFERLSRK
jgi:replicative superfamily II helicase